VLSEAEHATRTRTRTMSAEDFTGEKMAAFVAFERTIARMRDTLESIERLTARLNGKRAK
jgi:hypothetical protein